MFEYRATVIRVIDGDTVDLNVDLGFYVRYETRIRLAGINAPEINAPGTEGEEARDYLRGLIPSETVVVLKTNKDKKEKYGRFLGTILVPHDDGFLDVNASMLAAGYAVPYEG